MMITLINASKSFGCRAVLKNVSFTFPEGQSTALLGANGVGKSTLLRLIAGTIRLDSGRIQRNGSVSWPVGFAGGFNPEMTGEQNARFVARLYGQNPTAVLNQCRAWSGLGSDLGRSVSDYSSGMRAKLAFALSITIPFDVYLFDEITAVGDQNFRSHCAEIVSDRLRTSSAIVVSHSMSVLREMCHGGVVLENGKLYGYKHVDGAIAHYNRIMADSI